MIARIIIMAAMLLGAILYFVGIVWAGITPDTLPEFLEQAVVVIGGALAANFGSVVGIAATDPPRKSFRAVSAKVLTDWKLPTDDVLSKAAAVLYFISLLLAVILWLIQGFSTDASTVIISLSYTAIGVAAAAYAISKKK